jgi:CheY-like chemotaxis protein
MDGYELARLLRQSDERLPGLRLIAITGYGQDTDRHRSTEAGFDAHLVKPVQIDELAKIVMN